MTEIPSPLPGTFYHRPEPGADPFKSDGDAVAPGDVIGLIEVMKTFIEIKAEAAGRFEAYLVEDAMPVQAGDALARMG